MSRKKEFLNFIKQTESLIEKINVQNEDLLKTKEKIQNTELIVPVVGAFSAGKSTLINSFLKDEILSTNITPETALATEIRYSNENYIEAVKENNEIDRYNFEDIETIKQKASNYQYLKLYINNEKVKEIEPLILVDMPGFDSPIDIHNKAIMNYLSKGVYFVVLMSVEDGNISKRLIRELRIISEFRDFTLCISKTNLKPQTEVEKIKDYVKEQLEDFDYEKDIVLLDDNGGENLRKILKSINLDNLYNDLFLDELKSNYFNIDSTLSTKISTIKNSKEEAQNIIEEIKSSLKKLENKKQQMIENVEEKYSLVNINSLIERVIGEIVKNEDYLIDLAIKRQGFENELNEIIRNSLMIEIKYKFENISSNIVEDFKIELSNLNFESFNISEDWIDKLANSTENLIKKSLNGLETFGQILSEKNNRVYKAIASVIAISTNVLAPIVEIVILFLPEILNFVMQKSKEEKLKNEIRSAIHTQIIPKIRMKLKEELPIVFNREIENLINVISEEFENKLQEKRKEIESTLKEKEENIQNIEKEIALLENIKNKLATLANEMLFKGVENENN